MSLSNKKQRQETDLGTAAGRGDEMAKYRVLPMIRWVDSAEGTTLLDLSQGKYWRLNSTAGMIWAELLSGQNINGIVQVVVTKHNIVDSIVRQDVLAFISKLVNLGYIYQLATHGHSCR